MATRRTTHKTESRNATILIQWEDITQKYQIPWNQVGLPKRNHPAMIDLASLHPEYNASTLRNLLLRALNAKIW